MRHTYKYLLAASILGLASCGGKKTSDLDAKVAALGEIKTEISSLEEEVRTLRKEIKKLDPNWGKVSSNPVLVEVVTLSPRSFTHNVEVRATVASRKNVQVSSESMGRIVKLNALEGKEVRKGEIIVKIDAEQIRDKMAEVETGLSLAESIYKKQKNLWEKHGIGSEVKFLESKNKYEGLLKQKESLQTQLNLTSVKAPFSGTIDYINVREGELVQPGTPLFRIVSLKDLYLDAQVSEGYIGRIKRGDEARVKFTAIDHTTVAKVKSVSKVIDAKSRTFTVELPIQDVNGQIQPNSLAIAYLPDLQIEDGIVVSSTLVQRDDKGVFVFVIENKGSEKLAVKRYVKVRSEYDGETSISEGLNFGDQLITAGARKVMQNASVKVVKS